jgi:hypothetical protein
MPAYGRRHANADKTRKKREEHATSAGPLGVYGQKAGGDAPTPKVMFVAMEPRTGTLMPLAALPCHALEPGLGAAGAPVVVQAPCQLATS